MVVLTLMTVLAAMRTKLKKVETEKQELLITRGW